MADMIITSHWRYRLLFTALAFVLIFWKLLPSDQVAGRWPGPDLILLLAYVWVLRRPAYVPVLLVAGIVLLTDIIFMRPLGLWTACVVLGLEFLRARELIWRDMPYLFEWMMVSATIVSASLGYMIILAVFSVDQPPLGLSLIQIFATVAAYPLVELFSSRILGLRRVAPGAVDQLGRKL